MIKRIFAVFIFLASGWTCFQGQAQAQATLPKTESRQVHLKVVGGYRNKDSSFIIIQGGSKIGVKEGANAHAFSVKMFRGGQLVRDHKHLGFGNILRVFPDSSICYIAQIKSGNLYDSVLIGDLIRTWIDVPVNNPSPLIEELAMWNIFFLDIDGKFIYSLPDVLNEKIPNLHELVVNYMLKDLQKTYEKYKDVALDSSLLKPLTSEGRFKGRIPFEMSKQATAQDVENFLLYVASFPAGYLGQNGMFNSNFIGWVQSNSNYSTREVYKALFGVYKNRQELTRLAPIYKKSILSEEMINSYCDSMVSLHDRGLTRESTEFRNFAWALADVIRDTAGKGQIMLSLATMNFTDKEYRKSVQYADSAIYYAKLARKRKIELNAFLQKTEALALIPKTKESLSVLEMMDSKLESYRNEFSKEDYDYFRQRRCQYTGWVNYESGVYNESFTWYTKAADLNILLNTYNARVNNARIFKNLGMILKAQGKDSLALDYFYLSASIYDSVNDVINKAIVYNEAGGSYYNAAEYKKAMGIFEAADSVLEKNDSWDNAGYSKSMIGNCYWSLGNIDKAIQYHNEAIEMRRNINAVGTAYSWNQLGSLYQINGYKKLALDAYDSSRNIFRDLRDSVNLADNYNNKGLVFHNDENYKKAINNYDSAMGYTSKVSVTALFNLGNAWFEVDKARATKYLLDCERKSDSSKNLVQQFKALGSLMVLAYRQHDYTKGDAYYQKAAFLLKEISSPEREAKLLSWKGSLFSIRSMIDSSIYYNKKAQAIFDTVNLGEAIWTRNNLSDAYVTRGEFDKGEKLLQEALKISRDTKNAIGEGYTLQALSFLYCQQGELKRGMALTDTAAPIFQHSGNNIRLANVLNSRGLIYKDMGNYKQALENLFTSDSLYIVEGTEDFRLASLNNIGVVYFYQADYAKSIEYFTKTEKYFKPGEVSEIYVLNRGNIAEAYYYQKKYKDAEKILLEVYPQAISHGYLRLGSREANVLGKIYFDQGLMDKSLEYFRQGLQYSKNGTKEEEIDALIYLGKIDASKGNVELAEKSIREAKRIGDETGMMFKNWEPYYELGILFYNQKKYDSAISNLKKAVDIVEINAANIYGGDEARKMFTSDVRKVDLYSKIIASYVAINDKQKASEYALRNSVTAVASKYGKDFEFANEAMKADLQIANDMQKQTTAIDASISKATTPGQKKELEEKKIILEQGYQEYLNKLVVKYPDLGKYFNGRVNPESFSDYKGDLPDDMAVVAYVINDNKLIMFIVTNETLEIRQEPLKEDINLLINEYINALTSPDSASGTGSMKVRADFVDKKKKGARPFAEISEKLYGILIEDLYNDIRDKQKLCIIPSGKLSNIPFQCLGKKDASGKFHFLAEEKSVFYTNKMDQFRDKRTADRNLADMAAFGNPDKSLEFAKKEVLDIQKVSKASTVFIETSATEEQAKKSLLQNKYVHFATHGTLNYTDPLQSYLTFTKDATDDGRLTISEVDSMLLRKGFSELVTLSACETAKPLEISKDWYVSPANSFLRKRFKSVLASLWKVNDEATGILMTEFYKNLETMDKVDALKMAQIKLSNNPLYVHPFYWGGFVLYGDWR